MTLFKHILTLALSSAAVLSLTCEAASLGESLAQCRQITQQDKRLECYDQLNLEVDSTDKKVTENQPLSQAIDAPSPAPAKAVVAAHASQQDDTATKMSKFGLTERIDPTEGLEKVASTVMKLDRDPYKKWLITLALGQQWQQIDSVSFSLHDGDEVYVEKGALGSYFLGKPGSNKRIRVKRIN